MLRNDMGNDGGTSNDGNSEFCYSLFLFPPLLPFSHNSTYGLLKQL
jgi:hypothetical protein